MIFDGLPDIFTTTFGQTVTITPSGGTARDITAIFRRSSEGELFDPGIVSSEAYLSARSEDVTDIAYDDAVDVGGVVFLVGALIPEDKGMTKITLRAST